MQIDNSYTPDFGGLAQQFDGPGVRAIALMGSYARGDAGPYSDVDILRLVDENLVDNNLVEGSQADTGQAADDGGGGGGGGGDLQRSGSYLIDDRLVNVSNADATQVEAWFTEPQQAVTVVASLRDAQVLIDRDGAFAQVKERANTFVWDDEMQAKADAYASQEMVGWIEEVHKGLEGLRRMDLALDDGELEQEVVGRLLLARFGCTFGLSNVVQVQRGIALNSDNAFFADVAGSMGHNSPWSRLRAIAFGVGLSGRVPTLREQVEAGLLLYVETAKLLDKTILPEHKPLIKRTVDRISEYW